MSILGKSGLSRVIEYTLCVLMVVAFVLTVTLYWSIPEITLHDRGEAGMWYEKYFVLLTISGILSLFIIWQARCIMCIINRGTPFITDMVRRLRIIAIECLVMALIYFVSIFVVTKFFMVAVFVTFSVVGMIILVFAQLFFQAIQFKEENDMTI